ncbi:hypothetical protein R54767_04705 [Paraburkholderia gardini]|uniref:Uncharacterized protein n=2 Tax=Paraburkholderia gardini TaxID=2823469 RepID=A0ABM8U9T4_9BURK|nr:hypothetical protein R54767_04705 [Paraburkholderia gardini]
MAEKVVLRIPVDSEEFDGFLERYHAYQESVAKSPEQWRDVNAEINLLGGSFEKAASESAKIEKSLSSQKLTGAGGTIAALEKSSARTAKSWEATAKSLEKSSRFMAALSRGSINLAAFGGVLGATAGAAAAVGGAVAASASDIAGQNQEARSLDLPIGATKDFAAQFERFGLKSADLSKFADAAADVSKWQPLITAGLTPHEIQTYDPERLAYEFDKRASAQYREDKAQGRPAGSIAEARGYTQLLGLDQIRTGASYSDTDFDKAQQAYKTQLPKFEIDEKDAQKATDAKSALDSNFDIAKNRIESAFTELTPEVIKASNAFTDLTVSFLKSKELKKFLDELPNHLNEADAGATWLNDKIIAAQRGDFDPKFIHGDSDKQQKSIQDNYKKWLDSDHKAGVLAHDTGAGFWPWDSRTDKEKSNTTTTGSVTPSSAARLNNPGNLRVPGSTTEFQKFASKQAGLSAMDRQLNLYYTRDHLSSIEQILTKYAPTSENDTAGYIADVSGKTGFRADEKLNLSDLKTRAALEAAMIQHESSNFKEMNADYIAQALSKGITVKTVKDTTPTNAAPVSYSPARPSNDGRMAPVNINLNINSRPGADIGLSTGALPY